ncbi:uncharacterized protein MYCFIDRAFT_182599 [Pseudocercospora fijiensis CIRAD86]|uniref:Uncharacterized protein n=1 Tax=Pseudocercospora fijiensis (strain CIRAD86) TaxID=383855 RepID=M2YYH5_PSEFD|nr:uncharacterized protein MYCFIDRAFT_182599 [Pseudocercospora fijiensis CIRAD86]EME82690.1 hypothetical protein MYCFIDRAFT_182599 [Pseudocercospora fijiensis CIRAD86]
MVNLPWWKFALGVLAIWGLFELTKAAIQHFKAGPPANAGKDYGDLSWYCRRDCGKSWEEAEPKGCVFDELEFRFTHPECINDDAQKDFAESGPGPDGKWLYAIDVDWRHSDEGHGNIYNGTNMHIINSDELRNMIKPKLTVWHSNLWHISHCLWYWRKVSLSRFDGTLLPMDRAEEAEHSYHCTRMIINYLRKEHLTDQYKTSFSF